MFKKIVLLPSSKFTSLINSPSTFGLYSNCKHFFSSSSSDPFFSKQTFSKTELIPDLKKSLQTNGFDHLTKIQELSLPSLLDGQNAILQAETGSGKTLCYILPILNHLFPNLASKSQERSVHSPTGALVLAPNKELCTQIYSFFKIFDPQNQLNILRLGALNQSTPSATFQKKAEESANESVTHLVNWGELDLLISTPVQLANLLKIQDKTNPYNINPRTVVIDEYDYIFGDVSLAKATRSLLKRFNDPKWAKVREAHEKRQFILCGASAPRKIGSISLEDEVKFWFQDIKTFRTQAFQKLSERIKFEYIEIEKDTTEETELLMLNKLIKISASKKIIIFCNSAQKTLQVQDSLTFHGVKSVVFSAGMSVDERVEALAQFNNDNENVRVLISTDLGSRGLDFKDVDHVIQFEFATHATQILHRAGRTGRAGNKGTFTSFVRPKDELLMSRLNEMLDDEEKGFEGAYSHKRSLRKKERRRIKEEGF